MKTDPKHPARAQAAFTRLDLATVLLALTLCAAVVLPALASSRPRSQRVMCANNLRQIGQAFHLWGIDNGERPLVSSTAQPSPPANTRSTEALPFEVITTSGGTGAHPLSVNVWLHFSWLSNDLSSPALLLCPSDTGRPARDFSADPTGGYIHPNFANAATSYLLGHYGLNNPLTFVSTDRNLGYDASGTCSLLGQVRLISIPNSAVRWTAGLHNSSGNLLRREGSVEQLGSADIPRALGSPGYDNSSAHYITPR